MCTMLAHTCVVVVHVLMFLGSKSAPLPSCGSIVLQMACNCFISQKPVECFSGFQRVECVLPLCSVSLGSSWYGERVYWSAKICGEGSGLSIALSGYIVKLEGVG